MTDSNLNEKLCSYLLKLIDESRTSINHVAELSGISQSNLNRILTDHKQLSQNYIEKICAVFRISVIDFYVGALTTPYSLDELRMHALIHATDEKQYPGLLMILNNIQIATPKKKTN